MEGLAAQTPAGAYGVIPIFSDAMDFSRWYHASPSFLNLSLDPARCSKGVIFRALEENAAIVAAINLERVREFAEGNPTSPLVFAGGASKGKLWPQIVADVTGREIRIPVVREATSLGGAAAAGVGIGIYRNLAEAAGAMVRWERNVEPNLANRAIYDDPRRVGRSPTLRRRYWWTRGSPRRCGARRERWSDCRRFLGNAHKL